MFETKRPFPETEEWTIRDAVSGDLSLSAPGEPSSVGDLKGWPGAGKKEN